MELLPELMKLTQDEEKGVRLAAFDTIVNLMEIMDSGETSAIPTKVHVSLSVGRPVQPVQYVSRAEAVDDMKHPGTGTAIGTTDILYARAESYRADLLFHPLTSQDTLKMDLLQRWARRAEPNRAASASRLVKIQKNTHDICSCDVPVPTAAGPCGI